MLWLPIPAVIATLLPARIDTRKEPMTREAPPSPASPAHPGDAPPRSTSWGCHPDFKYSSEHYATLPQCLLTPVLPLLPEAALCADRVDTGHRTRPSLHAPVRPHPELPHPLRVPSLVHLPPTSPLPRYPPACYSPSFDSACRMRPLQLVEPRAKPFLAQELCSPAMFPSVCPSCPPCRWHEMGIAASTTVLPNMHWSPENGACPPTYLHRSLGSGACPRATPMAVLLALVSGEAVLGRWGAMGPGCRYEDPGGGQAHLDCGRRHAEPTPTPDAHLRPPWWHLT